MLFLGDKKKTVYSTTQGVGFVCINAWCIARWSYYAFLNAPKSCEVCELTSGTHIG